jgi:hypothetical protein
MVRSMGIEGPQNGFPRNGSRPQVSLMHVLLRPNVKTFTGRPVLTSFRTTSTVPPGRSGAMLGHAAGRFATPER